MYKKEKEELYKIVKGFVEQHNRIAKEMEDIGDTYSYSIIADFVLDTSEPFYRRGNSEFIHLPIAIQKKALILHHQATTYRWIVRAILCDSALSHISDLDKHRELQFDNTPF